MVMEPVVPPPESARGLVSLAQPRYCQGPDVEVADDEVVVDVAVLEVVSAEVGEEVVDAAPVVEFVGARDEDADADDVVDETAADDVEDEAEVEVVAELVAEVEVKLLLNWYICSRLPAPQ
jgi:hypothetical protein